MNFLLKPREASVADVIGELVHDIPDELNHRDRAKLILARHVIQRKLDAKET